MQDWIDDYFAWLLGLLFVALITSSVLSTLAIDRQWRVYAVSHHCVAKGRRAGQTSTGIGPAVGGNGGVAIVATTPLDQTIYVCDGGEIQIR